MRSSRSGRCTVRSIDRRRPTRGVDVYLFPAVVGGGLGDIEEVLAAGRTLAGAGFPVYLYRAPGRPLPPSVAGPWAWPPLERVRRPVRRGSAALTVSPSWGVSAAPDRPGPLGRGGAWAEETSRIEAAYGPGRTLHVSLEEFARTGSSEWETRERFREGGVRSRELGPRVARARAGHEVEAFRDAFVRFRAFERPNVLHVFATFRRDRGFAREFPAAVQTGPLWPRRFRPGRRRAEVGGRRAWVWYASPSSAEALARAVVEGLRDVSPPVRLFVRTPRAWSSLSSGPAVTIATDPRSERSWRTRFRRADVRIVTGSRTLLEAIECGGRFLYFNGVLGQGAARRRHRPEKLLRFLELAREMGIDADARRDLADFARGRRVAEVVRRVARRDGGWARWTVRPRSEGFAPPYDQAGQLLRTAARRLARPGVDAREIVRRLRAGSHL